MKEENENKIKLIDKIKGFIIKRKSILLIILAILILISIYEIICGFQEKKFTITAQSSLEKIIEISELSTMEYTYNAIATKYKDNVPDENNVEYYVSYEGIVTVGIDFNAIKIEPNEEEKKIVITLPEVEKHDILVNMGTMEYIYVKNTKEQDKISQEAYLLCKEDLKNRVSQEVNIEKNARENAISAVEALFEPWNDTYQIEVK